MDSRLGMGIRGFIPRGTCFGVVGTRYEKTFPAGFNGPFGIRPIPFGAKSWSWTQDRD